MLYRLFLVCFDNGWEIRMASSVMFMADKNLPKQQSFNYRPQYAALTNSFGFQLRQTAFFGLHQLHLFPFSFGFLVFAAHRRIVRHIGRHLFTFVAVSSIGSGGTTHPLPQPRQLNTAQTKTAAHQHHIHLS